MSTSREVHPVPHKKGVVLLNLHKFTRIPILSPIFFCISESNREYDILPPTFQVMTEIND